ncbi:MAG TPA: 50S ribosomal protein L4 [Acidimicrobiales bacterium]|nr:50S ribosomal protein L4 [Acidimicrobiales bacterium]
MALTVDVRDVTGSTTGSVNLDETLFGIQPNVPVMHQVVTAQLAAARSGTQSTKTRAEVSGGGRKPFRQKGTGRARQGSERAPHFAGGGVALGPKPRSYRQRTPRKMVQLALRSALSDRASEGKVVVVGSWPWDVPSTKEAKSALAALGLDGRVLLVLSRSDEEAYKSFRNLPGIQLMLDEELNAYDILCNDWIVFTSETLPGGSPDGAAAGLTGGSAEADQRPADSASAPAPAPSSTAADKAELEDGEEAGE